MTTCKNSNIEYLPARLVFDSSKRAGRQGRNSKQYLNSNYQNSNSIKSDSKKFWSFKFWSFGFVSCFGFRISDLILSFICLLAYLLIGLFAPPAEAFTMSNDNWILEMGNFNMSSGKPTSSAYKMGFTAGQTAPGLYSGTNYKVKAGFWYIYPLIDFSFSISQTLIDFGTLTPTNPVTRTNELTVSNGSAYGYSVTAFENHELLVPASGSLIPDTTCDDGTCSETTAREWNSSLTYGFGYRCDNLSDTDCASGFLSNYYKQFSNADKSETPQSVMSGTNAGQDKKVQITYKVNISGTQGAGVYHNTITYIATPTY